PLGSGLRFPLPFGGGRPGTLPASVPAAGTALHPQLCLSTKEPDAAAGGAAVPGFPFNTVQELTAFSHNTNFGDFFRMNAPELGRAQGRSHLAGRVLVQFGERFGDSVPVAVSTLPPGGALAPPPDSPLA